MYAYIYLCKCIVYIFKNTYKKNIKSKLKSLHFRVQKRSIFFIYWSIDQEFSNRNKNLNPNSPHDITLLDVLYGI